MRPYKMMATEVQSELRRIYNQAIDEIFNQINNNSIDLNVIIQNYTIDLKTDSQERLITLLFDQNLEVYQEYTENYQENFIGNALETVTIARDYNMNWITLKCFTFFSSLQKKWRHFQMYFKHLSIKIKNDLYSIPHENLEHIFVAFHSPNTYPDISDGHFKFFTWKYSMILIYSQLSTHLLPNGYEPFCNNYDLDYKHGNFNMRADCVAWCYQRRINELCKTNSFVPSHFLFRKDKFNLLQNKKIEHCFNGDKEYKSRIKVACYQECQIDCSSTYYNLESTWLRELNDTEQIELHIEHNNQPDIAIKYIPKITFLSLVCNFGGLLGMWLGVSILFIIEESKNIILNIIKFEPANLHVHVLSSNRIIHKNKTRISSWSRVFIQTHK